jgi:hypothetical protein
LSFSLPRTPVYAPLSLPHAPPSPCVGARRAPPHPRRPYLPHRIDVKVSPSPLSPLSLSSRPPWQPSAWPAAACAQRGTRQPSVAGSAPARQLASQLVRPRTPSTACQPRLTVSRSLPKFVARTAPHTLCFANRARATAQTASSQRVLAFACTRCAVGTLVASFYP